MDHAEAIELIEVAAAEPAGIDRLMAGDTAEAARLAGHLADCTACADELVRMRRLGVVVREIVRDLPPEDLRERTLARVAAVGRPRAAPAEDAASGAMVPAPVAEIASGAVPGRSARPQRIPGGSLAAVAAVLIAVVGTGMVVSAQRDADAAVQAAAIERADQAVNALARVSAWSMRVSAEADSAHVVLSGTAGTIGADARGTILFAPGTGDLVVVVSDLAQPPDGQEYRCWVDAQGERRAVGRMFFGGGLAYWVGPVEALADVVSGTTFGISLVDANGSSLGGEAVLSGRF